MEPAEISPKTKKITVLITRADHPCGLGTARALRGVDAEVVGLCTNPNSRFCKSNIWDRIIPISGNANNYFEELICIGKSLSSASDQVVLFPIQDPLVELISAHRNELEKYYRFVFPDKATVNLLMDKVVFHRWAEEQGFPVPESYIANSAGELNGILDKIKYPIIIKPTVHTAEWDALSPIDKVLRLQKKERLEEVGFNLFQAAEQFLVQQWIPGGEGDIHFCLVYIDRNGNELGYYTGRKLAQWPVDCGSTAACIGTSNPVVHDLTLRIFRAADFAGLGSVEFKQSAEDGKYYIVEPTVGRNDLQSYVAVAGGVNLTRMAFYDAIGLDPAADNNQEQKASWIEEYSVIQVLKYCLRKKDQRYKEILKCLSGRMSFSHFELKDPWPFICLFKEICGRKMKKAFYMVYF